MRQIFASPCALKNLQEKNVDKTGTQTKKEKEQKANGENPNINKKNKEKKIFQTLNTVGQCAPCTQKSAAFFRPNNYLDYGDGW